MKVYIVGGTFDGDGGRQSGLIGKIAKYVQGNKLVSEVRVLNGGNITDLIDIYEDKTKLGSVDVIMWFANVPNEFDKYRNIKELHPKKMLVTSKRNNGEYAFNYLVNHALSLKANLVLEFSQGEDNKHQGRVFDPLAAVWVDTTPDFNVVVDGMLERLDYMRGITRVGTIHLDGEATTPNEDGFVTVVKSLSDTFHDLIHPAEGVSRFLGNASFRCRHGFPSFRAGKRIYVTRRNVDKRDIGLEGFVAVERGADGTVTYYGDHKPSVDTPIQLALYEHYTGVNYMVHSHVYIEGAPFTTKAVPCGGMEEIDEVIALYPDTETINVAINLIGHGSLILADDYTVIDGLVKQYRGRPVPEVMVVPT